MKPNITNCCLLLWGISFALTYLVSHLIVSAVNNSQWKPVKASQSGPKVKDGCLGMSQWIHPFPHVRL